MHSKLDSLEGKVVQLSDKFSQIRVSIQSKARGLSFALVVALYIYIKRKDRYKEKG